MVLVPSGTFEMGSTGGAADERPSHPVEISHALLVDKTEVTAGEYARCEEDGLCTRAQRPSEGDPHLGECTVGVKGLESNPASCITWSQARSFCRRFRGGRLPTEAEWEYIARAGATGARYIWGAEAPSCEKKARFRVNFRSCKDPGPRPVPFSPPNAFGVHDLTGSVKEWTLDWADEAYYASSSTRDPRGPCEGADACPGHTRRVLRGGGWTDDADLLPLANRFFLSPDARFAGVGFRCVRDVDPGRNP